MSLRGAVSSSSPPLAPPLFKKSWYMAAMRELLAKQRIDEITGIFCTLIRVALLISCYHPLYLNIYHSFQNILVKMSSWC